MSTVRRALPASAKILSVKDRTCSYTASDQTLDSDREVIRAAGWDFSRFQKNAPFVDSHNYESVACMLGNVTSYKVEGQELVEGVQFLPEGINPVADMAWKMTDAGFLKAVSVGFRPLAIRAPYRDPQDFAAACKELRLTPEVASQVCCIHWNQEQTELSSVLVGANPSAVAKAHRAGALTDEDFHKCGIDDDGLTFLHEAAQGYEAAPATLRQQIRKELRRMFQISASTPNGKPGGNEDAPASAIGNESQATAESIVKALASFGRR